MKFLISAVQAPGLFDMGNRRVVRAGCCTRLWSLMKTVCCPLKNVFMREAHEPKDHHVSPRQPGKDEFPKGKYPHFEHRPGQRRYLRETGDEESLLNHEIYDNTSASMSVPPLPRNNPRPDFSSNNTTIMEESESAEGEQDEADERLSERLPVRPTDPESNTYFEQKRLERLEWLKEYLPGNNVDPKPKKDAPNVSFSSLESGRKNPVNVRIHNRKAPSGQAEQDREMLKAIARTEKKDVELFIESNTEMMNRRERRAEQQKIKEIQDESKRAQLDRLDPIPERHFQPKQSTKFLHDPGNDLINIKKDARDDLMVCKCKPYSYKKIINVTTPHHFGKCPLNKKASIFARGFNTSVRPDPKHLKMFKFYVDEVWAKRNMLKMKEFIWDLDAKELSLETFIANTAPEKRSLYLSGIRKFQRTGEMKNLFELISKPNELHYDSLDSVRPRMLCNPDLALKTVGSYLARICIKAVKQVEPGFISGYSTDEIAQKFECWREMGYFTGDTVYSYDGSSHDAHQHAEIIKIVDHFILSELLPIILARSDCIIEECHKETILKNLATLVNKFFTTEGMRGELFGTVFSGHPTLTTLFNTLRTILYNRYLCWCISPEIERDMMPVASGDDSINDALVKLSVELFREFLGTPRGKAGLGQNPQDLIFGKLEEHSFLSKKFVVDYRVRLVPTGERLYKAGAAYNIDSSITPEEHKVALYVAHADLPKSLSIYRDRFERAINKPDLTPGLVTMLKTDWAYRLKLRNRAFPSELDSQALMTTDEKFIRQCLSDERTVGRRANILEDMPNAPKPKTSKKSGLRKTGRKKKPTSKNKKTYQTIRRVKAKNPAAATPKWINRWHAAESAYAKGLLDPDGDHCERVPSLIPIPTAVARLSGRVTLPLNGTGYGFFSLNPYTAQCIWYCNGPSLTDTASIPTVGATYAVSNSVLNTSSVIKSRVVSASLRVVDLSTALNRTGMIISGTISRSTVASAVWTSDAIKDAYYCSVTSSQANNGAAGGVWLPCDPSCLQFTPLAQEPFEFMMPVAFFSGCAASANISLEYTVNYEFIPSASQSDLIRTDVSDIGDAMSAMREVGEALNFARASGMIGRLPLRSPRPYEKLKSRVVVV